MRKLIVVFAFMMLMLGATTASFAETSVESKQSNDALKTFMASKNSKLSDDALNNLIKSIDKASTDYNIEKELIVAVMWQESNFDPSLNYKNSIGAMQIYHTTGKAYGYSLADLYNSDINIKFGAKYLSGHIQSYNGDVLKALSAYNQGTTRVNKGTYSKKYETQVAAKWNTVKDYVVTYIAG